MDGAKNGNARKKLATKRNRFGISERLLVSTASCHTFSERSFQGQHCHLR